MKKEEKTEAYFIWQNELPDNEYEETNEVIIYYVDEKGKEYELERREWEEPGFQFYAWFCNLFNILYVDSGDWYYYIPAPPLKKMKEMFPKYKKILEV